MLSSDISIDVSVLKARNQVVGIRLILCCYYNISDTTAVLVKGLILATDLHRVGNISIDYLRSASLSSYSSVTT